MRRAPETIDPAKHAPEPGESFAGDAIAEMVLTPNIRIPTVTILLSDESVLTYEEGALGTWNLRDAVFSADPAARALESAPPPSA